MSRLIGSWLSGPQSALEANPQYQRGDRFHLPAEGPGSLATMFRRAIALCIDWMVALSLSTLWITLTHRETTAIGDKSTATLVIWFVISFLSGWLFSRTLGMVIVGIGVARVDKAASVGVWRALVRSILTVFVVPAVITDEDGRGMHDRATGTAVIRSR